jgi:hypothetical protein
MKKAALIESPRVEPCQYAPGYFYVVVRGCGWTMDPAEIEKLRDTLTAALEAVKK